MTIQGNSLVAALVALSLVGCRPSPMPSTADLVFERSASTRPWWPAIEWTSNLDPVRLTEQADKDLGGWLAAFDTDGAREAELTEAMGSDGWRFRSLEDPLLEEAASWMDARELKMPWHEDTSLARVDRGAPLPAVYAFTEGLIARGDANPDREAALLDYRRVVSLGLLLADSQRSSFDVSLGLHRIRKGCEAIIEEGLRRDDAELALAAALVIREVDSYLAQERLRGECWALRNATTRDDEGVRVDIQPWQLACTASMAIADEEPAYRIRSTLNLAVLARCGNQEVRAEAQRALREAARTGGPFLAELATSLLEVDLDDDTLWELARRRGRDPTPGDLPGWPAR